MLDGRRYHGAKEIIMKIKKVLIIIFLLNLLSFSSLQSETKYFTDKNLDYNVVTEVSYVGLNIPKDELDQYSSDLFDWCKTLDKNTKKIEKITKEYLWGTNKAISDYNIKQGETYIIRISSADETTDQFQWITLLLLTITNINGIDSGKYYINSIYESYVNISQNNTSAAEDADPTFYSDSASGFSGRASAKLSGINLNQNDIDTLVNSNLNFANSNNFKGKIVNKLTKEQAWLLGKSLAAFSLKEGETYTVAIIPEPKSYPTNFTSYIVIITIDKVDQESRSYNYRFIAIESTQLSDQF